MGKRGNLARKTRGSGKFLQAQFWLPNALFCSVLLSLTQIGTKVATGTFTQQTGISITKHEPQRQKGAPIPLGNQHAQEREVHEALDVLRHFPVSNYHERRGLESLDSLNHCMLPPRMMHLYCVSTGSSRIAYIVTLRWLSRLSTK